MCVFVVSGSPHVQLFCFNTQCTLGGQDIGNLHCDPEEFARTLCDDLSITDPEVGVCLK
jgi:hypothetical protein